MISCLPGEAGWEVQRWSLVLRQVDWTDRPGFTPAGTRVSPGLEAEARVLDAYSVPLTSIDRVSVTCSLQPGVRDTDANSQRGRWP